MVVMVVEWTGGKGGVAGLGLLLLLSSDRPNKTPDTTLYNPCLVVIITSMTRVRKAGWVCGGAMRSTASIPSCGFNQVVGVFFLVALKIKQNKMK